MHQVQPLFDELCDPFSSTATLDGFSLLPAKSVGFFWSASEFSIPIVSTSPGLSNENCGRGLCRLVGSVPRMALLSIFFSFLSKFIFISVLFYIPVVYASSLSITRC